MDYHHKNWTKQSFNTFIGDPQQVAGAVPCILTAGKADGVRAVQVRSGGGLDFMVLPGRGMDIAQAAFKGQALSFLSGTGITSPAYYDEPGFAWLRSFFAGLVTTCGIANSGAPSVDQDQNFGLHGRLSNAGAEDVCVEQNWRGDDYVITVKGKIRETAAMFENLSLTRTVETHLGAKGFILHDCIENHGFEPQPLMLLYHCNFGFPLLAPGAEVVGPVTQTEPRNENAAADNGVDECLVFPEPQPGYEEQVFFHQLGSDTEGNTFVAQVNADLPLALVMRFNRKQLPQFTQWKMPRQGFYVQGLEPGTVNPWGRGVLRERNQLPMIDAQQSYDVTISYEVLDSLEAIQALREESKALSG